MRRLPGPADHRLGDGGDARGFLRVVSGLAENTNSIFCDSSSELEAANGCPVLLESRNHQPRGTRAHPSIPVKTTTRSPARVKKTRAFRLTKTYMDGGHPTGTLGSADTAMRMPFPSSATKTSTKCWRQSPLDCLSDVGSPWPKMKHSLQPCQGNSAQSRNCLTRRASRSCRGCTPTWPTPLLPCPVQGPSETALHPD